MTYLHKFRLFASCILLSTLSVGHAADEITLPTLQARLEQQGKGVTVHWSSSLRYVDAHYDGAPVEGEGHGHLYLDDKLIGPLKDNKPHAFSELASGPHKIRIVLARNNHAQYDVSRELAFTVD